MNTTHPMRILLVEDWGQIRRSFNALLKELVPNSQIYEAANFDQAVDILASANIDFAFVDIELSKDPHEKSGLDLLNYKRQISPDTRVIMLSGYTDSNLVNRCLEAGAMGYIPKAMEGDAVILQALQMVLQGMIYLPAQLMTNTLAGRSLEKTPQELGVKGRLLETLYYICQGNDNKTIAKHMGVEADTVRKDYVSKLLKLFKVKDRKQLMYEVSRLGIVVPKPQPIFGKDD